MSGRILVNGFGVKQLISLSVIKDSWIGTRSGGRCLWKSTPGYSIKDDMSTLLTLNWRDLLKWCQRGDTLSLNLGSSDSDMTRVFRVVYDLVTQLCRSGKTPRLWRESFQIKLGSSLYLLSTMSFPRKKKKSQNQNYPVEDIILIFPGCHQEFTWVLLTRDPTTCLTRTTVDRPLGVRREWVIIPRDELERRSLSERTVRSLDFVVGEGSD